MKYNSIIKILCSIPVIVIIGYFIPFIGACLIITRYFVYSNKKYYSTSLNLLIICLLIAVPKGIVKVLEVAKIENITIPYLDTIVDSQIYPNILNYSKFLIGASIVFFILSIAFKNILTKLSDFGRSYINNQEQIQTEVFQKNDMEMKVKQEKAKKTQVVYCPHCGADNILSETVGNCKYCRRSLSCKEKR